MNWLTFAILAALSYGFYNFFAKLSSDKLSPTIGAMFISGTAFLVAAISTIIFRITGQNLSVSKNGILFPIIAGLFAGLAEVFYLFMFSKNTPVSLGNPLVVGGTTFIAVILGLLILKEPINLTRIIGILATLIGLIILSRS